VSIDSFNKGDPAAAEAANVSTGVIIIDEVAPHLWQGPGAHATMGSSTGFFLR